ncbi:class I SAM-dependent methyltransferase [Vibrio ulleungensis]|uniref:Methyltransferase domain-containing protein n=1 Tax=Vibrio ulleungensis TaxID=2807619 RepID=A0ABS2HCA1_9VIBR|nr:class I SAM-dependent methyltransferase [Vibrio ulleungensis]MBM7035225.1 methyltransferase domain-containing protein [Vibrio ulleungensis]
MDKTESFWDKASKDYDKSEARFEYIHNMTRANSIKHLNKSYVALDYGCGTGTKSCELASYVKEIHAIDISAEMVKSARRKAADCNIENVHFSQATIFSNDYEHGSFDVIFAFNMLHTIDNPGHVLKKIYELLKPNGLLISSTPCLGGKKSLLVKLQMYLVKVLSKTGAIPISIRQYRRSDLDRLLGELEFDIVQAEEIFRDASSYFVVARKT